MWPKVDRKNTEYGGLDLKAFNLLMSNGVEGIFIIICRSMEMGDLTRIKR